MTDMPKPPLHRILMVEDDPDIRTVSRLVLEAIGGFTVELCESGKEALAKAPVFGPDLILLDVMMPEMDGPATLHALRQIPEVRETPVVFMTGCTQEEDKDRFKALGAINVISKPFDPMLLSQTVRTIWAE